MYSARILLFSDYPTFFQKDMTMATIAPPNTNGFAAAMQAMEQMQMQTSLIQEQATVINSLSNGVTNVSQSIDRT